MATVAAASGLDQPGERTPPGGALIRRALSTVDITETWRGSLNYRVLIVTFGVAGTIGTVEWLGLGHPIGLGFALLMGVLALLVAPLPWLWLLPWGLRRPVPETLLRAAAVAALSSLVVLAAFVAFFFAADWLVPVRRPLVPHAIPLLSAWSSVLVSIPLFTAAGWGLSRHLQLERQLQVQDARTLVLRDALEQARLRALQSRLDPHFLFNALNLVAELCREEPVEAERCVVRLSKLLRAVLEQSEQPLIPLGRELDLCEDYLELCRVRFGERLQVQFERDAALERARVPFLAVQVLCENAVRHGVERKAEGGEVRVRLEAAGPGARIEVTSPGPYRGERKGGLGIELIRRRLALAFHGGGAELSLQGAADGQSTVATLTVPALSSDQTAKDTAEEDQA